MPGKRKEDSLNPQQIDDNPMLSAAIGYVAQEFKVFPVKLDKKPLTEHGLLDATGTLKGVRKYWERWPDAGIGLPGNA